LVLLGRASAAAGSFITHPPRAQAPTQPNQSDPRPEIRVSSVGALHSAIDRANRTGGFARILIEPGRYAIEKTLVINAPNIALGSTADDSGTVVIEGDAMRSDSRIGNLIRVSGTDFQVAGLTLQRCGNHLLQIAGESGAHRPRITRCVFRDSFEQMLKVSYDASQPETGSEGGIVEDCLFEYTAGIGPQWYVGGVDAHRAKQWAVRRNRFRHIASPSKHVAEHAIHFWSGSQDILVEGNVIIDCDRGVGFGMPGRPVRGGAIRNNMIHHRRNGDPYADVGIILEDTSGVVVSNNTIFLEHDYPSSIEYRFEATLNILITNNLCNRAIRSRDGGSALVRDNFTNAKRDQFVLSEAGNLRLVRPALNLGAAQ
jgi:Right handed beta helix region